MNFDTKKAKQLKKKIRLIFKTQEKPDLRDDYQFKTFLLQEEVFLVVARALLPAFSPEATWNIYYLNPRNSPHSFDQ